MEFVLHVSTSSILCWFFRIVFAYMILKSPSEIKKMVGVICESDVNLWIGLVIFMKNNRLLFF